ncbi:MAG: hypothetical protein ABR551_09810 [Gemmatimonadales bacterium]
MIRSVAGFAGFAIVALIGLKLIMGLIGGILSLVVTVLWFAFWGWIFYMILKMISPDTARSLREMITGKPASA